jgi:hypothetical protein
VPTYLLQFSDATDDGRIRKMMKDGLPYDLCHRLLQHKVLWLLSMHPQDVLRVRCPAAPFRCPVRTAPHSLRCPPASHDTRHTTHTHSCRWRS